MRSEISEAYTAARRCLEAMTETQDLETRQSLWRAASRYAGLAREKVATAVLSGRDTRRSPALTEEVEAQIGLW